MKGYLVLETGESFEGRWRGGAPRASEIVFNTSHTGFEEVATDPSYFGQSVLMTTPMMGNYKTSSQVWESYRYWFSGFMALQIRESEFENSWINQLREFDIPTLTDLDTRQLTLRLRDLGTPVGALVPASSVQEAREAAVPLMNEFRKMPQDWVWEVSQKEPHVYSGFQANGPRCVLLDFGFKKNILRELQQRCSEVITLSSRATPDQIETYKPDFIMLSNGPGDPSQVQVAPMTVAHFIGKIPIFGICMGHQILSIALGAKTFRLKFGHRGANHPIRDELLDRVYMSSQNHGYAVDPSTLSSDIRVTQRHLNDQSVAGICSPERKFLGIQYHPESRPGPHESVALFDYFLNQVMRGRM